MRKKVAISRHILSQMAMSTVYWGRKEQIGYIFGKKSEDGFNVHFSLADQNARRPNKEGKYAEVMFNSKFKKMVIKDYHREIFDSKLIGDYHSHTFRSNEISMPPEPSTYEDDPEEGGDLVDMYKGKVYFIVNKIGHKKPKHRNWEEKVFLFNKKEYVAAVAQIKKIRLEIAAWHIVYDTDKKKNIEPLDIMITN